MVSVFVTGYGALLYARRIDSGTDPRSFHQRSLPNTVSRVLGIQCSEFKINE